MKMNTLALAILLLTGSGVSDALATSPASASIDNPVSNDRPEPAASAVMQKEREAQSEDRQEVSAESVTASRDARSLPHPAEETSSESARQPLAAEQRSASEETSDVTAPVTGSEPSQVQATARSASAEEHSPDADSPATVGTDVQKPAVTLSRPAEPLFTPEQEARMGEVMKDYLLKHPKLLLEVDNKLQKIQYDEEMNAMISAALLHQDELLDDRIVPAIGPEKAEVAVIGFFDYQCTLCAHQATLIQSVSKKNPQVRFIYRDWPIFGYRWKLSFKAAETGLRIWQQKGGDAYMKYHNALFATGHVEGALTQKDITKAASAAGKLKNDEVLDVLSATDILAKNIGLQGTPGIVVMPVKAATTANVTVFPVGATESMLQEAIDKALAQTGS